MKLLIITQKVDIQDDILGFFHRWILEFARICEHVTVICLEKGEYHLPSNIKIISLGKEKKPSRFSYVLRFYQTIWKERNNYDVVFVHMNPIYIILAGCLWRMMGKKVSLWYTHKQVNLKLRVATYLSHMIFTASRQSFGLRSKKVNIVGHGIDLDQFQGVFQESRDTFNLVHIGRITRIKNCSTLIMAANLLKVSIRNLKVIFVGSPVTLDDIKYKKELDELVVLHGLQSVVNFVDSVPHVYIKKYYEKADITVNMTPTGGVDKVVLESMASSVISISSNESFTPYFGMFDPDLRFTYGDYKDLSSKIDALTQKSQTEIKTISMYLKDKVSERSSLKNLIGTIIKSLQIKSQIF